MPVVGSQRRFFAEVRFGANRAAIAISGGAVVYDYWHHLHCGYDGVLLPPEWRSADGRATWIWDQPSRKPAIGPLELSGIRQKLMDGDRRCGPAPVAAAGAAAGRVAEIVRRLAALADPELIRYICATTSGLRLHSWGAPDPAVPHALDPPQQDIYGRVMIAGANPARLSGELVLETAGRSMVDRTQPDESGEFIFSGLPPNVYRVHANFPGIAFAASVLTVELSAEEAAQVVFEGLRANAPAAVHPKTTRKASKKWPMIAIAAALMGGIAFVLNPARRGSGTASPRASAQTMPAAASAARQQSADAPAKGRAGSGPTVGSAAPNAPPARSAPKPASRRSFEEAPVASAAGANTAGPSAAPGQAGPVHPNGAAYSPSAARHGNHGSTGGAETPTSSGRDSGESLPETPIQTAAMPQTPAGQAGGKGQKGTDTARAANSEGDRLLSSANSLSAVLNRDAGSSNGAETRASSARNNGEGQPEILIRTAAVPPPGVDEAASTGQQGTNTAQPEGDRPLSGAATGPSDLTPSQAPRSVPAKGTDYFRGNVNVPKGPGAFASDGTAAPSEALDPVADAHDEATGAGYSGAAGSSGDRGPLEAPKGTDPFGGSRPASAPDSSTPDQWKGTDYLQTGDASGGAGTNTTSGNAANSGAAGTAEPATAPAPLSPSASRPEPSNDGPAAQKGSDYFRSADATGGTAQRAGFFRSRAGSEPEDAEGAGYFRGTGQLDAKDEAALAAAGESLPLAARILTPSWRPIGVQTARAERSPSLVVGVVFRQLEGNPQERPLAWALVIAGPRGAQPEATAAGGEARLQWREPPISEDLFAILVSLAANSDGEPQVLAKLSRAPDGWIDIRADLHRGSLRGWLLLQPALDSAEPISSRNTVPLFGATMPAGAAHLLSPLLPGILRDHPGWALAAAPQCVIIDAGGSDAR